MRCVNWFEEEQEEGGAWERDRESSPLPPLQSYTDDEEATQRAGRGELRIRGKVRRAAFSSLCFASRERDSLSSGEAAGFALFISRWGIWKRRGPGRTRCAFKGARFSLLTMRRLAGRYDIYKNYVYSWYACFRVMRKKQENDVDSLTWCISHTYQCAGRLSHRARDSRHV